MLQSLIMSYVYICCENEKINKTKKEIIQPSSISACDNPCDFKTNKVQTELNVSLFYMIILERIYYSNVNIQNIVSCFLLTSYFSHV